MAKLHHLFAINKILAILFLFCITTDQANGSSGDLKLSRLKSSKTTHYFGLFKNLPSADFCVLYDGEEINVKDQSFLIKDQMLGLINILFIDPEKIKFSTEENTVVNLQLDTEDYTCYELQVTQFLTPSTTKDQFTSTWKISEKRLGNKLPINTIVIPLSPKKVNIEIQNSTWKPNNLAIKLPSIKIGTKNKQDAMDELMLEGYLKCMALKPFHAKQKVESIVRSAMKISMVK